MLDAQSVTIADPFPGIFNWTTGTLHVANFNGNLLNQDGTLAPGHSAGSTVVAGNYTQQPPAVLEIEIGGVAQSTQFDFVNVTGTATLDGLLDLHLIHGFHPTAGQTFAVVSAASLLGAFDNAVNGQRMFAADGISSFIVNYGPSSPFDPHQVVLSSFQLAADFDEDGDVDGDDLALAHRLRAKRHGHAHARRRRRRPRRRRRRLSRLAAAARAAGRCARRRDRSRAGPVCDRRIRFSCHRRQPTAKIAEVAPRRPLMNTLRLSSVPRRLRRMLSPIILLLATVPDASAANRRWSDGNGIFSVPGNWQGGIVPGVNDVAQFGLSSSPFQLTYAVSFATDPTNQALHIEDDLVTFDLNGHTYTTTAATGIIIGNQAGGLSGQLTVQDSTINSPGDIDVGAAANASGTLIVTTGGLISGSPNLNIGKLGPGTLTIQSGGDIFNSPGPTTGVTTIGVNPGITGSATITGSGSSLTTGTLNVGSAGNGTVDVLLGGSLHNTSDAVIGAGSPFTGVGTGVVNVTGSFWESNGLLTVGNGGSGEVNITGGGRVSGEGNVIGDGLTGHGEVNVDGPSSRWINSGPITVGGSAAGTLNITNQAVVESLGGRIGNADLPSSTGTVNVSGAGSRWFNYNGHLYS